MSKAVDPNVGHTWCVKAGNSRGGMLVRGCAMCGVCQPPTEPLKVCNRCKSASYCSKEHQKAHWKEHKKFCIPQEKVKEERKTSSELKFHQLFNRGLRKSRTNMKASLKAFRKARDVCETWDVKQVSRRGGRRETTVTNMTGRFDCTNQIFVALLALRRYEESKKELKILKQMAPTMKYPDFHIAVAKFRRGQFNQETGNLNKARKLLEKAAVVLDRYASSDKKFDDGIGLSVTYYAYDCLHHLSLVFKAQGDRVGFNTSCKRALVAARRTSAVQNLPIPLMTLGSSHMKLGQAEEAVKCFEEAAEVQRSLGIVGELFVSQAFHAFCYSKLLKDQCLCTKNDLERVEIFRCSLFKISEIVADNPRILDDPAAFGIEKKTADRAMCYWGNLFIVFLSSNNPNACKGPGCSRNLFQNVDSVLCKRFMDSEVMDKVMKMFHLAQIEMNEAGRATFS